MFIAACQSKSARVQSFVDGIYVNHAQGEFAIADDTLTFTHTEDRHYIITRNTGYQAIREGRLLPRKRKLETFEGDFDPSANVLNETTAGRVFHFDPAKGILVLNRAVYRKLN